MNQINKTYLITAALLMVMAIALGAFGAHALRDVMGADQERIWQTAVHYHMIHGLAILALSGYIHKLGMRTSRMILVLFVLGIVCFSGSLYILAITDLQWLRSICGPVTPVGGLLFIIGWMVVALYSLRIVADHSSMTEMK